MKWLLVVTVVAANAVGDLLNAAGMKHHGEVKSFHPGALRRLMQALMRNSFVVGGVAIMAVAFFAQMSLLSISNVSFAVPASASSYMIETILAKIVLGEHITRLRWAGAVLVGTGVALLQF